VAKAALVGPALALVTVTAAAALWADDWPQWGRSPQHDGSADVVAQPLDAILASVVYDPFVAEEKEESGDDLLAHYPVPLLEGNSVFLGYKSGAYRACNPPGSGQPAPCGPDGWGTQIWGVKKLTWQGTTLQEGWSVTTDWKPVPNGPGTTGWEPVFHPVLTHDFLWAPGAFGAVYQVAKDSGQVLARIAPFATANLNVFVAGGLAADAAGNVYYNAIQLAPSEPWRSDVLGAWLVKVTPAGVATSTSFTRLVAGAPGAGEACTGSFSSQSLPWPPSPGATPSSSPCGSQRPGINVIPAIAPDGTVYTVSRAHLNDRYSYLVAANADLSPRWAASLRGILRDGCGVLLPASGTPGGCRGGAAVGVDPATNEPPAGRVLDQSSSSPVVLPDGGVLYGAYTRYNFSRGHLLHFDSSGRSLGSYDFGWDVTPAAFRHGGTYSIVVKDNLYDTGSYCNDETWCPVPAPRYAITQLDSRLRPEWSYVNTTDVECIRGADGAVSCTMAPPGGFEWCVNQPVVDASGVVHANAEDGFVYAIGPGGIVLQRVFLDQALGAAYTPLSIGADGLVYAQNGGRLFVVGRSPGR
jgi:hypothetical protein